MKVNHIQNIYALFSHVSRFRPGRERNGCAGQAPPVRPRDMFSHLKRHLKSYILIIIILLLAAFILAGLSRQSLELTVYDITSPAVSNALDGYKIIHISDFHSGLFSGTADDVIKMTAAQSPDIICLTGDIVDGRTRDFVPVEALVSGLSEIAPVYAVSGNNEHYETSINAEMNDIYSRYGVRIMDGRTITIYRGGTLTLSGIADSKGKNRTRLLRDVMSLKYGPGREGFGIILYHRANEFYMVADTGYDLVLSGHLHGGIITLPKVGGILSPDSELFPKYSGGLYEENGTFLVSNRGIGNNHFIPRIYTPPEVVLVTLRSGE